ncbi:hypothetical protein Hypma_004818 [Hypsizygus marmoreus]|uniref:Uncharacterized protein n=1 Tax=Hypsizygus marmoreus TaxID=39966 RepID=A0A369J460_HYPMA|nr:hypothetical protein Hypma_004818 [Hypsizygus marmoreus]
MKVADETFLVSREDHCSMESGQTDSNIHSAISQKGRIFAAAFSEGERILPNVPIISLTFASPSSVAAATNSHFARLSQSSQLELPVALRGSRTDNPEPRETHMSGTWLPRGSSGSMLPTSKRQELPEHCSSKCHFFGTFPLYLSQNIALPTQGFLCDHQVESLYHPLLSILSHQGESWSIVLHKPSSPMLAGYAPVYMDLTLEAYRNIVKNLGNRADIATLCRVSKGFQYVGERALYNTLYMRDIQGTISLCATIARQPRLSVLVEALTIYLSDDQHESDGETEDGQLRGGSEISLPEGYWTSISSALEKTTRLRYLNIHVNNNSDKATAWIFNKCTFRLKRFHCDLDWDRNLVAFLNTQVDLDDLYIIDYNEIGAATPTTTMPTTPTPSLTLDAQSLPNLTTLECTFSEAAIAIVPGRPITHLKTCFSRSELSEKRAEMTLLFSKLKLSTRPIRSLDIADSSYSEAFSMELLSYIVRTSATTDDLHYIGTLVLPIMGKERLQFYGLLMHLPRIECVEVEVSEWVPPPETLPAFRALVGEMRLYSPTVNRVVFVKDFDRTVVTVLDGIFQIDGEISIDILWREI